MTGLQLHDRDLTANDYRIPLIRYFTPPSDQLSPMLPHTIKTKSPSDHTSPSNQTCYFSLVLQTHHHFSDETPCSSPTSATFSPGGPLSDPNNPLLALRQTAVEMASPQRGTLLQLQTSTAHPTRPRPVPLQDMFVTSDDSTDSTSSSDSGTIQTARCSRCHRTTSVDSSMPHKSGMLQYGLNQWYCTRCATIVGYGR